MLFHLFIFVLLLWPTESSGGTYTAVVGQNVLLPCSYVVKSETELVPICWGRGSCPTFGCYEEFLTIDEQQVIQQKKKRYHLKANHLEGDVSLTIENVEEADSGIYCCRIQFKGLFNDRRTSLKLVVKPAETTTLRLQPQQTSRNTQSNNSTEKTSPANKLQNLDDFTNTGIFIGVSVFIMLVLALALVTLILKRHSYSKKKLQNSSVIFNSNPLPKSIREIAGERNQAEENLYTIEENIYEIQDECEYSRT